MADNHSKEVRSKNMSHIRSVNSKPEEIVRKYLFSRGLRYRKNVRTLPGCPDIVLPKAAKNQAETEYDAFIKTPHIAPGFDRMLKHLMGETDGAK